jgi:ankyrin repeat protein
MGRHPRARMTTGGCGTVFAVANLLLFMGLMYWAWRYGINHYLCVAAVSGDLNTAETMLRLGASPNYRLPNGDTPLTLAARAGHPLIVISLLRAGADVNLPRSNGETPLFAAVEGGHLAVARILLENRADANRAHRSGVTPLMIASRDGRVDMVQLLLAYGADPTVRDLRGFDAFHFVKGKKGQQYQPIEQLLRAALSTQGEKRSTNP